jgi:membrane-bound ClpP family serine protease
VTVSLIIILILFGIVLLVLEILVLPGLVAGIIGVVLMLAGILWMYTSQGDTAGHITLFATLVTAAGSIYYSLKSKAWERFGLKGQMDKPESNTGLGFSEGDEAIALSAMRPMGTIMAHGIRAEAQTNGELITAGTTVIILKISPNKIIVKPKT